MAINENISLRFTGQNDTKTTFKDINESAKSLGQELTASGEIGKQALGKIASASKDGVTPAVVSSFDAVQGFAKEGLWGGLAALAGVAIGKVVEHFNHMKEIAKAAAQSITESLTNAFKESADALRDVSAQMSDVAAKASNSASNKNSAITSQLGLDVVKIQAEANAKALEAATAETEALIRAEAQVKIALLEKDAAEKKATNTIVASEEALRAATETRVASEKNLQSVRDTAVDIQSVLNTLGEEERQKVSEYLSLKENQNRSVEELTRGGMDYVEALRFQKETARRLAEFEDENADFLEVRKPLLEQANESTKKIAEAERALSAAEMKELDATTALENAQRERERVELAAKMKVESQLAAVEDAKWAIEEKAEADREAAKKELEAAEKEKKIAEDKEKRAIELDEKRKADQERMVKKVEGRLDEKLVEDKSKKEKKIKLEANAIAEIKELKKAPGIEEGQKKQFQKFKDWEQDEKQRAREDKERATKIQGETRKMVDYLKKSADGTITKEQKDKWTEYLSKSGMTYDEIKGLGQQAADAQLLSMKEWKTQSKIMGDLLKNVKESLTAK